MKPTVLLFDIDGTLITTGGVGRNALVRALAPFGASEGASFSFAGMTDRGIIRQGLLNSGKQVDEALIDEVMVGYLEGLETEVAEADAQSFRVHAGVHQVLDAVSGKAGVAVGLGTGNVEVGARIKLRRVALSRRFGFGGFGCDAEDRAELIAAGARRGAELLECTTDACRVVIIGDTPRDIAAANAIDAECAAVATGSISREELARHQPTFLFDDLTDPGCVAALLGQP